MSFFLVIVSFLVGLSSRHPEFHGGLYSRLATPVWYLAERPTGLTSPDGSSAIHARKNESVADPWPFEAWVVRNGQKQALRFGGFVNAEVAWSPDSPSFAVTYSDGGAVGRYHLITYHFKGEKLVSFEPVAQGSRLFKVNCFESQEPNVHAIRWETGSTLLIALEVPPHSSCTSTERWKLQCRGADHSEPITS